MSVTSAPHLAVRVGWCHPEGRLRVEPAWLLDDIWYFSLSETTAEAILADLIQTEIPVRGTWVVWLTPVRTPS